MNDYVRGTIGIDTYVDEGNGEYSFTSATLTLQNDITGNGAIDALGTIGSIDLTNKTYLIYLYTQVPGTTVPNAHRYKLIELEVISGITISGKIRWDEPGSPVGTPIDAIKAIFTEGTTNKKMGLPVSDRYYNDLPKGLTTEALVLDIQNIVDIYDTPGPTGPAGSPGQPGPRGPPGLGYVNYITNGLTIEDSRNLTNNQASSPDYFYNAYTSNVFDYLSVSVHTKVEETGYVFGLTTASESSLLQYNITPPAINYGFYIVKYDGQIFYTIIQNGASVAGTAGTITTGISPVVQLETPNKYAIPAPTNNCPFIVKYDGLYITWLVNGEIVKKISASYSPSRIVFGTNYSGAKIQNITVTPLGQPGVNALTTNFTGILTDEVPIPVKFTRSDSQAEFIIPYGVVNMNAFMSRIGRFALIRFSYYNETIRYLSGLAPEDITSEVPICINLPDTITLDIGGVFKADTMTPEGNGYVYALSNNTIMYVVASSACVIDEYDRSPPNTYGAGTVLAGAIQYTNNSKPRNCIFIVGDNGLITNLNYIKSLSFTILVPILEYTESPYKLSAKSDIPLTLVSNSQQTLINSIPNVGDITSEYMRTPLNKSSLILVDSSRELYRSLNCIATNYNSATGVFDSLKVPYNSSGYIISERLTTKTIITATPKVYGRYEPDPNSAYGYSMFIGFVNSPHDAFGFTDNTFVGYTANKIQTGITFRISRPMDVDPTTTSPPYAKRYFINYELTVKDRPVNPYGMGSYYIFDNPPYFPGGKYSSYPNIQFKVTSEIIDNGKKIEYRFFMGDADGSANFTEFDKLLTTFVLDNPREVYPCIALTGRFNELSIYGETATIENASIIHEGLPRESITYQNLINNTLFNRTSVIKPNGIGVYRSLNCYFNTINNEVFDKLFVPYNSSGYIISERLTTKTIITATPKVYGRYEPDPNSAYGYSMFIGFVNSQHGINGFTDNTFVGYTTNKIQAGITFRISHPMDVDPTTTSPPYAKRYFINYELTVKDRPVNPYGMGSYYIFDNPPFSPGVTYSSYPNVQFKVTSEIIDNGKKIEYRFFMGDADGSANFTEFENLVATFAIPDPATLYPCIALTGRFDELSIYRETATIENASIIHEGTDIENYPGYTFTRAIPNIDDTLISDIINTNDSVTDQIESIENTDWNKSINCIADPLSDDTISKCNTDEDFFSYLIGKNKTIKDTSITATPNRIYTLENTSDIIETQDILKRYLYIGFIKSINQPGTVAYDSYVTNTVLDGSPLFIGGIMIYTTITNVNDELVYNYNYQLCSKYGFGISRVYYTTKGIKMDNTIVAETEPNIAFKVTYILIDNNTKAEIRYYMEEDGILSELKNTVQTIVVSDASNIYPFIGLNSINDNESNIHYKSVVSNIKLE